MSSYRRKTASTVASVALAALLAFCLVLIGLNTDRQEPDNPITSPDQALATAQMLVSPTDEEGDADDQGDNQDDEQQQDEEQQQEQQEQQQTPSVSNQFTTQAANTPASAANGASSSDNGASTNGGTGTGGNAGTGGDNGNGTGGDGTGNGKQGGEGVAFQIDTNLSTIAAQPRDGSEEWFDSAHNLNFYARAASPDAQIVGVQLRNANTSNNDTWLDAIDDSGNYRTPLAYGSNTFTISIEHDGTTERAQLTVTLVTKKASKDDPNVGDHPPTIVTNPEGDTDTRSNMVTYQVLATSTDPDHPGTLTGDHIAVTLGDAGSDNGTSIGTAGAEGGGYYGYDLPLESPNWGDERTYTVGITAWDDYGNSSYTERTIVYHYTNSGAEIGSITVNLDLTAIGLGVKPLGTVSIRQDENMTQVFNESLEPAGYYATWKGSYLAGIESGGIAAGAQIPDSLMDMLTTDGLAVTSPNENSLSEYDFTQGSGWMYFVDGTMAGRNIGTFKPQDGQTVTLYFTIAWGKDCGQTSSQGILSRYCGTWMNGTYTENHNVTAGSYTVLTEPTCTEPGVAYYKCANCGKVSSVTGTHADGQTLSVPALGHDWQIYSYTAPTETQPGMAVYQCSRCGAQYTETIPATGGQ